MKTGYTCTAYFQGKDGLGACDTECQWWQGSCPCAKGSEDWDGIESDETDYPDDFSGGKHETIL